MVVSGLRSILNSQFGEPKSRYTIFRIGSIQKKVGYSHTQN
jgi:hypothetical protein